MKTPEMKRTSNHIVSTLLRTAALAAGTSSFASTDYGPAVWRPVCDGKWYTTGYGKKFYVIHDMEGYYLTGISYLQRCDVSTSVHYVINGLKDVSSDAAPGEVSQLVRDSYYAWHARCWNQHSMGTEHEGFANNPAWYTDAMYQASALLTRSKATKYGFAKDRNHIVGHDEDRNSAWVSWADTGLGIDPTCNTHHDPGAYWDWSYYMDLINPAAPAASGPPLRFKMDANGDGKMDIVLVYKNGTSTTARICLSTGSAFSGGLDTNVGISFGTPNVDRQWIPMDVNGDGKTDLVLIWNNGGVATARTHLSTGSGFGSASSATVAGTFGTMGVNRFWTKGDVNGDGKEDLIMVWNNDGAAYARMCHSTGSGFGITSDSSIAGSFGTLNVNRQWIPMDCNGDGKKDLVMIWDNAGVAKARQCPSTGTNFTVNADAVVAGDFGTLGLDRLWLTGDVNADSKEDLIMIWNKDGGGYARMCHSSGTVFGITSDTSLAGTFGTLGVDRQWIPMDVNGDGKKDLVMIWKNAAGDASARTCLSSGSAFGNTAESVVAGTFGTINLDRLWLKGDVNGDGKEDIVLIWNNGGVASARACLTTGTTFGITSDTTAAGTFGTLGVDRVWLPSGM
jgi:hypothetical protein